MKILLVTETLHAGGAETFVLRLARKLNELGDECDVLNLNPDIEDSRILSAYSDLRIHGADIPALPWVRRLDRVLARLGLGFSLQGLLTRRLFEQRFASRYDVFHTNLFKTDLLLAQVKRRLPHTRFVSTLHGDYILFDASTKGGRGERILGWNAKMDLVCSQCDGWVYISDKQAELLTQSYGVALDRLHKIYNGYEPPVPPPPPTKAETRDGLTFIMVARGIKEKGWEYLILAFQRIEGGSRLLLVGEGPFLDELRKTYDDDSRIEFLGFHPNPTALIQNADAFVFASVYESESLPTVVVEALYCRVPVISTATGEIPAMLATPDGEICGQLITLTSHDLLVDGLADAMRLYASDRALLARHRNLTGAAFGKFDMTQCAENYRIFYRRILTTAFHAPVPEHLAK